MYDIYVHMYAFAVDSVPLLCPAALGALSCVVLMFFINAAYAGVTIGTCTVFHCIFRHTCICV